MTNKQTPAPEPISAGPLPEVARAIFRDIAEQSGSATGRPYVVAQLGQSLDGRIATVTGDSRWINGGAALDCLHRLRAAVDAIVVGAGTVHADDPSLTVRRGAGRADAGPPARVVIDPRARLTQDAKWLRDDDARRIAMVGADTKVATDAAACTDRVETIRLPCDEAGFAPTAIIGALAETGFQRVLVEGGATTISRFIDAGVVDRLILLVGPILIGSGRSGLDLDVITTVADARRPRTEAVPLPGGDVLIDCRFDTLI